MARFLYWGYLFLFFVGNAVFADRIKDMIYMSVDGVAACFRRHNGTHQFGCSSSRSGSVGIVHIVENEDDVRWLETNGTAGLYTVVMPFLMFTRETLIRLKEMNNINGVLLARNSSLDRPSVYSPEDTCPNRYSGYKRCNDKAPWNPYGSALLLEDWSFPMFYMENDTLLEEIKSCFWKHNAHNRETQSKRSLCALEMKSFMFAAIDSESCIRRSNSKVNLNPIQLCDPLGDRNIHWPLVPLTEDMESVIMVTARLDASSLFDGLSPGAGSAITGLVTLLATAYYLNTLNATVDKTNVMFSLLNGESFDYIGSSRLVYDIKEGNFNSLGGKTLTFDHIKSVIELGQLGKGQLYLHASNFDSDNIIPRLEKKLSAKVLNNSVPPASVQSFLAANPNLTAIVITNHGEKFVNKFYHGILDDSQNIEFNRNDSIGIVSALAKVATMLGNELYYSITGTSAPNGSISVVEDLISEMLYCYVESANCSLFYAASSPGTKLADYVLPLYVGVHRVANPVTSLTGQLLALLTGEKLPEMNASTCYEHHLAWMGGYNFTGLCINSTVNYSPAVSPAFIIDGYDMKSGIFSSWTESVWQSLSVRMFLKPSAATERLSMILGSVVTILSFFIVWFINSHTDVLFNSSENPNC
ncbi:nicastrin [Orussus abietinus]|uniref:nicastrin n=1 Tax=Orussus abietinus TaxID=222816 RepID=UPI0006264165|nr:nicastrin [Orussus abietinus]